MIICKTDQSGITDKRLPKAADLSMSWNVKKMGGVGDATITAPPGD